jgi:MFS family permease
VTTLIESRSAPRLGRDWRLLLTGSTISMLGDGMFVAALPLLAATMTSDPRLVAGTTAAGTLPWLIASLPAGALADRSDARRGIARVQWAQAGLVAVLAVVASVHAGRLLALYGIAFGLGVAETFVRASAQKLVPAVVPSAELERANGHQNASTFAAREFLGPPLGGLLFALATPLPFWIDAVSFSVSALLFVRMRARTNTATSTCARRRLRGEIGEGLRWLLGHRLIRTLSGLAGVGNLCNYLAISTLVLFARDRLGLGNAGYGVLVGAMAIGGVAGALLSRRLVLRFGGRRIATTTIFTTPAAMIAIGVLGHDAVVVGALATITSFGASVWNVSVASLRQRTVPPELFGRVSSAGSLISWGTQPIGAILGGLLAAGLGLGAPWIIGGIVRLGAAFAALQALREWRLERAAPDRAAS